MAINTENWTSKRAKVGTRYIRVDTQIPANSAAGRAISADRTLGIRAQRTRTAKLALKPSSTNRDTMLRVPSTYTVEVVAPKQYGGFGLCFKKTADITEENPERVYRGNKTPENFNIDMLRVMLRMARKPRPQVAVAPAKKPARQDLYESLVYITTGQEPKPETRAGKIAQSLIAQEDIAKVKLDNVEGIARGSVGRARVLMTALTSNLITDKVLARKDGIRNDILKLGDIVIACALQLKGDDESPEAIGKINTLLTNIYNAHQMKN